MYKPRKRLLESIDTKIRETAYFKKYNSFIIIFDTYMSEKEFENIRTLINNNFPIKLRDNVFYDVFSGCEENQFYIAVRLVNDEWFEWGWGRISSLEKNNVSYKSIFPKIYHISDIDTDNKIKFILNYGQTIPNYSPKKRLLENVEDNQYRFKTEKEFIKEYGPNWRYKVRYNVSFTTEMDYLLGTDLQVSFPDYMYEILISRNDNSIKYNDIDDIPSNDKAWFIVRQFITKKKQTVPNYNPKRFKDF